MHCNGRVCLLVSRMMAKSSNPISPANALMLKRLSQVFCYNGSMRKVLDIVLILGFLFVDLIFFHDVFKAGETTSLGQWLTGILSIPVIIVSLQSLLKPSRD